MGATASRSAKSKLWGTGTLSGLGDVGILFEYLWVLGFDW